MAVKKKTVSKAKKTKKTLQPPKKIIPKNQLSH